MRAVRLLQVALFGLVLGLGGGGLAGASEYIDLVVRPLDEITLKDGTIVKGRVVENLPDSIRIRLPGNAGEKVIPKEMINGDILYKQTAGQVLRRRAQQDLDASDVNDLQHTLKWGIDNNAKDDVLDVARAAMASASTTELAETLIPFLISATDNDDAQKLLQPLLVKFPQWSKGYEMMAQILKALGKDADLAALITQWLVIEPTAQVPNRYLAGAAEKQGNLRAALEAYRKGFNLYGDNESGLGFARTSLKLGLYDDAQTTADSLIKSGQMVDEATAIEGAVLLSKGDGVKAHAQFQQALSGKLSPETQGWVRYDEGLIAYRMNQVDRARLNWKDLDLPLAKLGLAMLDHQPFPLDQASPEMQAMVTEYNASILLENGRYDQARALLDPGSSPRQAFLAQLAALKRPTEENLQAVATNPSPESLRWQTYFYILLGKWPQAEAVVAQLPDNDGYAAVCRVYLAEARKDTAAARAAFDKVKDSINPPPEYVHRLNQAYEEAADELFTEKFDCPSEALSTREVPWTFLAPGTSIEMHTDSDKLILAGTQTVGQDSVTRLYRRGSAVGLRWVQASFDVAGANGAYCGLEILDSDMANGVAFAIQGDNHLGWRQETSGVWGPWTPLDADAAQSQVLRMNLSHGAVTLEVPGDDAPKTWNVATGLFKDQVQLTVSLFGSADPGTNWTVAVHDFMMQSRASAKPAGH